MDFHFFLLFLIEFLLLYLSSVRLPWHFFGRRFRNPLTLIPFPSLFLILVHALPFLFALLFRLHSLLSFYFPPSFFSILYVLFSPFYPSPFFPYFSTPFLFAF